MKPNKTENLAQPPDASEINSRKSPRRRSDAGHDSDCHDLTHGDSLGGGEATFSCPYPDHELRCNVGVDGGEGTAGGPTQSAGTRASYRARWPSLVRLATGREASTVPTITEVNDVATWLAGAHATYRGNSYRQYRAALMATAALFPERAADPAFRGPLYDTLDSDGANLADSKRDQNLPLRTSAGKLKRIDDDDVEKLLSWLRESKRKRDNDIAVFFEANIIMGLRPIEWAAASLTIGQSGEAILKVDNGKSSNGRGNGPVRTLTIPEPSAREVVRSLRQCLSMVDDVAGLAEGSERRERWNQFCKAMQNRFRRVNETLWPKRERHYALYSTRHTMLAEAKIEYDRPRVAALAGHASDETPTRHYARPPRNKAKPLRPLPVPSESEVATVRRKRDPKRVSEMKQRRHDGPTR